MTVGVLLYAKACYQVTLLKLSDEVDLNNLIIVLNCSIQ